MELMPEELDALERTCNSGTETWIGAVRRDTMVALLAAVRARDDLRGLLCRIAAALDQEAGEPTDAECDEIDFVAEISKAVRERDLLREECMAWRYHYRQRDPGEMRTWQGITAAQASMYKLNQARAAVDAAGAMGGGE